LEPSVLQRTPEGEYVISFRDVFRTLWVRLWLIVLVGIVFSGVALGLSFMQTPMYEASIKILVGQTREQLPPGTNPGANIWPPEQLTQTMVEGIKSRPVAADVIQQLDLQMTPDEVLGSLQAESIQKSSFIQVTYTDTSPERAQEVVNAIGEVFPERVSQLNPSETELFATMWERAEKPNGSVSPDILRNGLIGLVLGLMLGVGLAFLLKYLDDSWHSPEEVEQISGIPTFGVIPEFEASTGKKKKY
jgi:capsular polysaccharide biosynthesis protein